MSDTRTDDRRPRNDPPPPTPAPDPKAAAALKEQQAASSIGAQVILDYNGDGSLGARGGAGATIEENTAARDAHLISVGLDPLSPSGPPPGKPVEPPPEVVKAAAPAISSKATRMTSLAAGLVADKPANGGGTPPANGNGGTATAPTNTTVPVVEQAADTLTSTLGNWTGEPTSYAYAWQIDGVAAGTDSATHTVAAGDGGKSATCVVTATNAAGSTAAPPSNAVTITEPVSRGDRG